jgi:secreted trypsin-like serine protease
MKYLLLFILFVNSQSLELDRDPRIVGGINADIHEFPTTVVIRRNGNLHCAGTLLNEYWILTAAHCYLPLNVGSIEYGTTVIRGNSSEAKVAEIELFLRHENYNSEEITYDIGLIKVKTPIITGFHNAFAKLAMPGNYYPTGTPTVVAGFGRWNYQNSTTPSLQKANLKIWNYADCKLAHADNPYELRIHPHQICAGLSDFSAAECNG